jgi:hypothetical protein
MISPDALAVVAFISVIVVATTFASLLRSSFLQENRIETKIRTKTIFFNIS